MGRPERSSSEWSRGGAATLRHEKGGMRGGGESLLSFFLLAGFRLDGFEDARCRVAGNEQRHRREKNRKEKQEKQKALARGFLGPPLLGNRALASGNGRPIQDESSPFDRN